MLDDDVARAVEARVLPAAGKQTTGMLRAALRRAVIIADPQGAERRREQAEQQAKVVLYPDQDGTATLAGQRLSAVHAAAAMALISAQARAMKAAGAAGPIDLLRAQVFLGRLLGTLPPVPPAEGAPSSNPPDPDDGPGDPYDPSNGDPYGGAPAPGTGTGYPGGRPPGGHDRDGSLLLGGPGGGGAGSSGSGGRPSRNSRPGGDPEGALAGACRVMTCRRPGKVMLPVTRRTTPARTGPRTAVAATMMMKMTAGHIAARRHSGQACPRCSRPGSPGRRMAGRFLGCWTCPYPGQRSPGSARRPGSWAGLGPSPPPRPGPWRAAPLAIRPPGGGSSLPTPPGTPSPSPASPGRAPGGVTDPGHPVGGPAGPTRQQPAKTQRAEPAAGWSPGSPSPSPKTSSPPTPSPPPARRQPLAAR